MADQEQSKLTPTIDDEIPHDTYWVEGGLGKHVMFSAIIPALAKKSKTGKINMISAYFDVFMNNPHVANSWSIDDYSHNKLEIGKYITKLHNYEPYKGTFSVRETLHLVQDWADHYGVKWDPTKDLPEIHIDEKLRKKTLNTIKKKINGDYIVVQFTGGQPPINFDENQPYQYNDLIMRRNYPYPMARHFIHILQQKAPDLKIIDFSLPNEHPGFPGAIRIPAPYLAFYEIVKHAKTFVGIDSSLAHIAAAAKKPGIVLWGGTKQEQFGWLIHENLTNYNPSTPFNENDPFYVAIDYYYLADLVLQKIKGDR